MTEQELHAIETRAQHIAPGDIADDLERVIDAVRSLNTIADAADGLVRSAVGVEEVFNPSEYAVPAAELLALIAALYANQDA